MLEKIKKYKIILILLLFILFLLFTTNVNAATCNVDVSNYSDEQLNYIKTCYNNVMKDFKEHNYTASHYFICSIDGVTVTFDGSGKQFIIAFVENSHDELVSPSYSGDLRLKNPGTVRFYNFNDGSYTWSSTGTFKATGYTYRELKVYYTDYSNQYCNKKEMEKFPGWHIEYYEKYGMYYSFTDWFDVRNIHLTAFYGHGDHLTYSGDFFNIDEHWQWDGEIEEQKGTDGEDKYFLRKGFPLNVYGHYSYLQIDLQDKSYVLDALDFTEENLKGSEYEDCLNPFTHLNLYLDESSNTPTVYSNFIQKDLIDFSSFSISFDNGESFSSIVLDCEETHVINGIEYIRFYYKLYANDTYTFRLRLHDKNSKIYEVIKTFNISLYENIIDANGSDTITATPFINAYADTNIIRFSTQTFKERITLNIFDNPISSLRYDAYYIDEEAYQIFGDNYEDWIVMDVGYDDYDKVSNGYPYYFKTEFSFESLEDGDKFYFVFYDKKLGCFSNVTTYVLESKTELLRISQNITFNNDRFNKLYNFFNEHFGFLTYPLEFIINLLNRIFNIKYEEPILHIPQLKVPTSGEIIFNGLDYNLNSVLELPIVPTIYNIYLIAVDFTLVVYFVIHTKNTLEEVLGNG